MKRYCECPDEVQFWPPGDRVAKAARRLGQEVGPEEVERVQACLLAGRWLPSGG